MLRKFFTYLLIAFALSVFCLPANGQSDASTRSGYARPEEPLPKAIQENLKKQELNRLKKEYEELLRNGEEAVKLSNEVETAFDKNSKLSSSETEKLVKIEKLLKKIRSELGGDDDGAEVEVKKPDSIKNAVTSLKEASLNLFEELKKTSRYSISVVAIQSSNTLLNIVKYIRFWDK